ncbi:hypothetical protein PGT21_007899 [Puccinia graminis f. sp. tritici]|uniref:Uncharacterized protein n=2 Tax=Puccinia graminis f. sp. tritici TaxID=56615 RepID=H6QPR0_PUCGT|nr:uncharacterized protein PGTG_20808 [Puccinia graminis f. sp. tritici CRL 75-36-700-3]EHS64107.1 hypothetical protein PGTG_20808 [Puccinia graminis f. sp. tritici CRL 75-36-700-3]KAA1118843.1 hypothetical protein PGT21_007899 [Puccinia graminis f. sp. tritici]KAA1135448.1 hypothetical protein PGTUg99_025874 [Puccinia graminis f. sp. tritici]
MSVPPLYYDTFEVLKSDCSLPLEASLHCLIRSISCTLINMRVVINSQQCSPTTGTAELCSQDVDKYLIPVQPSDAVSETIRRFSRIIEQIDRGILNRMLLLEDNHKHTDLVSVNSARGTLCFKRSMWGNAQARKLTLQLSRNLKRVGSQLESFVYWTDNFLLASLADSTRDDVSNGDFSNSNHSQLEQPFNDLIDGCVDIAQAGWSIRTQLAQAHAILRGPSSLTLQNSNRPSSLSCRPRKSTTALRSKPKLQYEVGESLGRRLRHRSVRKFLPRKTTDVNRSIARLTALLEPDSSLKIIRVSRYLLEKSH